MARFKEQLLVRPDFQVCGQVDQKFDNSRVYVGLRQTVVLKPKSSNFTSASRKSSESAAISTETYILMLCVQNWKKMSVCFFHSFIYLSQGCHKVLRGVPHNCFEL